MTDSSSSDGLNLLSVTQVAQLLGVSRQRVHDIIKNNQIIAYQFGRYYYVETAELERYRNQPIGKPYRPRSTESNENSIDNRQ